MDDTKIQNAGDGQTAKLDIAVKVFPVPPKENSNLKAFASVTLGGVFAVTSLRVLEGAQGTFVSMPQAKGKDDKYHDICFPTTKEMRKEISDAVLSKYYQTRDMAAEKAEERPSVRKNLEQKKAAAVDNTASRPAPAPKKKASRDER